MRILALVLVLAGCGSEAEDALSALARTRKLACSCADQACVDAARGGVKAWHDEFGKTDGTEAQARQAQADLKAIEACLAKVGATDR